MSNSDFRIQKFYNEDYANYGNPPSRQPAQSNPSASLFGDDLKPQPEYQVELGSSSVTYTNPNYREDVRPTPVKLPSAAEIEKELEGHYVNPEGKVVPDGERPSEDKGTKYIQEKPGSVDKETLDLRAKSDAARAKSDEAFAAWKAHFEAQGSIKKGGFNAKYAEPEISFSFDRTKNNDEQNKALVRFRQEMNAIDGKSSLYKENIEIKEHYGKLYKQQADK